MYSLMSNFAIPISAEDNYYLNHCFSDRLLILQRRIICRGDFRDRVGPEPYCHEPPEIARSWPKRKGQKPYLAIRRGNTSNLSEKRCLKTNQGVKATEKSGLVAASPPPGDSPTYEWRATHEQHLRLTSIFRRFRLGGVLPISVFSSALRHFFRILSTGFT